MKRKVKETTTSGSISTVANPPSSIHRRGGNLLSGKKTSKKYANSLSEGQSIAEEEIHEEELLLPGQKPSNVGFMPKTNGRTDHEVSMAVNDLLQCGKDAETIYNILRGISETQGIPGWVAKKITVASESLNAVAGYMEGEYTKYAEQNYIKDSGYGVIAGGTTMEENMPAQKMYHDSDRPAQPWAAIDKIAGGKSVAEDGGNPDIKPGMKVSQGIIVKVNGNTVTIKAPNGDLMTMNIHDVDQAVSESTITEKAKSKQQQKFFGMVRAIQKGEKVKGASSELKQAAKSISKGDVKDFAKTKHEGLPQKKSKKKVSESIQSIEQRLSDTWKKWSKS
jgi:hypothetical protein